MEASSRFDDCRHDCFTGHCLRAQQIVDAAKPVEASGWDSLSPDEQKLVHEEIGSCLMAYNAAHMVADLHGETLV
jgi:hypothetical protein